MEPSFTFKYGLFILIRFAACGHHGVTARSNIVKQKRTTVKAQLDRAFTPWNQPKRPHKKLKTLEVNCIPDMKTVPWPPNLNSGNSPFNLSFDGVLKTPS